VLDDVVHRAQLDLDGWLLMHNSPGGRVTSVRPGRLPDEHKVGLSWRAGHLPFDRTDVPAQKALVQEAFAGAGWEAPRFIAALHAAEDFVLDSLAQVRLPAWSRGRVVLLGDAAWSPTPLTGLGTSLALVGAYVLARQLADAEPAGALRRYEEVLRPYVTAAQQLPPGGVAAFAPDRALDIRVRAASMRWMTRWPVKQLLARQFAKSDGVDLLDPDTWDRARLGGAPVSGG
jgi:2-polyprenyl-6-methoxyphenol hydroxylase-like FAD-dependent oxidoreductase